VPDYILEADQKLNADIYAIERDLSAAGTQADIAVTRPLRDRLTKRYRQRELLSEWLRENYPAYAELRGRSYIPCADMLSNLLPENIALIEYVCHDTVIWILAADNKGMKLIPSPADTSFYSLLQRYQLMLSQPFPVYFTKADYEDYVTTAFRIWEVLLRPCSEVLNNKSRIMVSHDARMGAFSFDGLIDSFPDTSALAFIDFRAPDYLVRKYAFTYFYSASWLYATAGYQEQPENGLLVFSPDYTMQRDSAHGAGLSLPPLEGAAREASAIAKEWKGTLYKGAEARVNTFLSRAPEASILHLAMHSVVDEENQLLSQLIFSCTGNDTCLLDAATIYSMRLKAALVVLSSCSSGLGRAAKGEGIMSLGRAFVYAGSRSVIMALWPVNDESGAEIMLGFYSAMRAGEETDLALQQAKLAFLEQSGSVNSHPSYWAAYILTGRQSLPDYHENKLLDNLLYAAIVLLTAGIVLTVHVFRRKRGSNRMRIMR
jgi:hypothetical protein